MSGIGGVYRTDGAMVDAALVARMARALARRGADAEGGWMAGPVALVHHLLATSRASLAVTHPVVDTLGECRLVWDGRLDNREELGAGHDESDETIVLRAYTRWGADCPVHLLGDFAFALWDGRRRRLLCARDRVGIKPFHYAWHDGTFRFASDVTPLVADLPSREPDDGMVVAWLLREFRPGDEDRTFLRHVRRLPPGHLLVVDERGLRRQRYWTLDAPPAPDLSADECGERFAALLRAAVAGRLRTDWPVGALLSGGLDSSAIVCTAQRWYGERGEGSPPLETFTMFSEHRDGDEREHAQVVAAAAGLKLHAVPRVPSSPTIGLDQHVDDGESPIAAPEHATGAACLAVVRDAGCRVLLSGEGGDQLLDEHGVFADLLRAGRPGDFVRAVRGFGARYGASARELAADAAMMLVPGWAKYLGKRLVRGVPPPWINRDTARAAGLRERVREPRGRTSLPSHAQRHTCESLTSPYYGLKLEVEERVAAHGGLEMRYPFLDSRLIEFVVALPWQRRAPAGERKALLRAAMSAVVPDRVLARRGKGDWTVPMDRALLTLTAGDGALADRSGMLGRYIDLPAARKLVMRYRDVDRDLRSEVWDLITVDRWLERFVKGAAR